MIAKLIEQTRSVRRFREDLPLEPDFLRGLIDLARLGGSARNGQVFRYMPVIEPALREVIFPRCRWAGYLADWDGPAPGERPPGYILCLLDRTRLLGSESEAYHDLGIATQNILLGAAEQGVFGCRIGAFDRNLEKEVRLPENCTLLMVLALGYPAETVVLEPVKAGGDIRYWRDAVQVHHVPKRSLDDLVVYPQV